MHKKKKEYKHPILHGHLEEASKKALKEHMGKEEKPSMKKKIKK